ncbi:MAG: hypothetical protein FJY18_01725, partial [Bacteroidetes bacterium]|nr:hypothetical protein [Bacteroidota bacterium]
MKMLSGFHRLLVLFALLWSTMLSAQSVRLELPAFRGTPGDTVLVPINVLAGGFDNGNVRGFRISLRYDTSALTFADTLLAGTRMQGRASSLFINSGIPGVVYLSFLDSIGLTRTDSALFALRFVASGTFGSAASPVTWNFIQTEFTNASFNLINDVVLGNGCYYPISSPYPIPEVTLPGSTLCALASTSFSVNMPNVTQYRYRWWVSIDSGVTYAPVFDTIPGVEITDIASHSLSIQGAIESMNGYLFYCFIDSIGGSSIGTISRPQFLRVKPTTGVQLLFQTTPSGTSFCPGTLLEFKGVVNGSNRAIPDTIPNPIYEWKKNGVVVATGVNDSIYRDATLVQDDEIRLSISSATACFVAEVDYSAQIVALPGSQTLAPVDPYCADRLPASIVLQSSEVGVRYILMRNGVSTGDTLTGTGSSINFGPRALLGTYQIRALSGIGCTIDFSGSAVVDTLPAVRGTVTADDTLVVGQSMALVATGGTSYEWSPAAGLSATNIANPVASPTATTTYTVIISNTFGCKDTLQVHITVLPVPNVQAGNDTSVCLNSPNFLLGGLPAGGIWSGFGVVDGTTGEFSPALARPGSYTLTYTYLQLFLDSRVVNVRPVGDTTLFRTLCSPQTMVVGSNVFSASGTYNIRLSNQFGCDSNIVLNLTVNRSERDTQVVSICPTDSFVVGTGAQRKVYRVAGTYVDTLTNAVNCDSIVFTQLSVGRKDTVYLDAGICVGGRFYIGTQFFNVDGNFQVTLLNQTGCDSIVHLKLKVNETVLPIGTASVSLPVVRAIDSDTIKVPVTAVQFNQIGSFNFGIFYDTTVLRYAGLDVEGTHLEGFQGALFSNVNGNRLDVSLLALGGASQPNPISVCEDTLINLFFIYKDTLGGYSRLIWDESITRFTPGGIIPVNQILFGNGSVYANRVTSAFPANNGNQNLCELEEGNLTIIGSGYAAFQWMQSTDGGRSFRSLQDTIRLIGANTANLQFSDADSMFTEGLYQCLVTGVGGSFLSIAQKVNVSSIEGVLMTLTADPAGFQCPGIAITFRGQPQRQIPRALYLWTINGDTVSTDSVLTRSNLNNGDRVALQITSDSICVLASNDILAQIFALPAIQGLTGGGSYCLRDAPGLPIGLSNTAAGVRYVLYRAGQPIGDTLNGNGSGRNFGIFNQPGFYRVKSLSPEGCEFLFPDSVRIDTLASVNGTISPDTFVYLGERLQLVATGAGVGGSYNWYPSRGLSDSTVSAPIASPDSTTTYRVVISNAVNCTDTLYVRIEVRPIPVVFAGNDFSTCLNTLIPDTLYLTGLPSDSARGIWSGVGIVDGRIGMFVPALAGPGTWSLVYTFANLVRDTLEITIRPPTTSVISQSICAPDSFVVGSQVFRNTGVYNITLSNSSGCDSLVILNLNVGSSATTIITDTICTPSTYDFRGRILSATGVYRDTIRFFTGCDSIVELRLTVASPSSSLISPNICIGGSFILGSNLYNVGGTYVDTIVNYMGCDSVVTLVLNVVDPGLGLNVSQLSLPVVQATNDSIVRISVKALQFNGIGAFSMGIFFDTTILEYIGADLAGSQLAGQPNFYTNVDPVLGNRLNIVLLSQQAYAVSVCDGDLFSLNFRYRAPGGIGISPLIWDRSFTQATITSAGGGTTSRDLNLFNGLVYNSTTSTAVPVNNGRELLGCELETKEFTVRDTSSSAPAYQTYRWLVSTDGGKSFQPVDTSIASGTESDTLILRSLVGSMSGNYYYCNISAPGGPVYSIAQYLKVDPISTVSPLVTASPSGNQCFGTPVTYSASLASGASLSTVVPSPQYQWFVDGVFAGTDSVLVVSNLTNGQEVRLNIRSGTSCWIGDGSTLAEVLSAPQSQSFSGGGFYCAGEQPNELRLLSSEPGVTYKLYRGTDSLLDFVGTGSALNFGRIGVPGLYRVHAVGANGCGAQMGQTIVVDTFPGIYASITPDTFIYFGGSVVLEVTRAPLGASYSWSPSTGLSSTNNTSVLASPAATTTYRVIVTNPLGDCKDTMFVQVRVEPAPQVSAGNDTSVCSNSDTLRLIGSPLGGIWSGWGITDGRIGAFVPSTVGAGTWMVVYTFAGFIRDTAYIHVRGSNNITLNQSICVPNSFIVGGRSFSTTGVYTIYLSNTDGCDSTIVLNLNVSNPSFYAYSDTLCRPQTLVFNGITLGIAGVYYDTITSVSGCDSVVQLTLLVGDTSSQVINASICVSGAYIVGGRTYNVGGTYLDTIPTMLGCDSFVTLNLTVDSILSERIEINLCSGLSYDFGGLSITQPGIYYRLATGTSGRCDTAFTLVVTRTFPTSYSYNVRICFGDSYDFKGNSLNATGIYYDTLINAAGCDSFITMSLLVDALAGIYIVDSICAPSTYTFGGIALTQNGVYYDTIHSVLSGACDTVVELQLKVRQPTTSTLTRFICLGDTFNLNGTVYNSTGIYRDTLINAVGCDSMIVLNLNVGLPALRYDTVSICAPSSYNFYGQILTASGNYLDTVPGHTAGICDTAVFLTLNVFGPSFNTLNEFVCLGGRYFFDGAFRTISGTYVDTISGGSYVGCDSIVTLNLTVSDPTRRFDTVEVCSPLTHNFYGNILSISGTYIDTIPGIPLNTGVCDTIVTLLFRVKQPSASTVSARICLGGAYLFNGQILRTAGTFTATLSNAVGCDSIVTLQLQIDTLAGRFITASICSPSTYTFGLNSLSVSGIYYDTLPGTGAACDTVVALNLTVKQPSATTINHTICSPNTYSFNGQSLTSTGTYLDTLTNAVSCDSVVTLNLLVYPAVQITAQPSATLTVAEGNTGVLSVVASNATAYLWQSNSGGVWTNLSNGTVYSGVTTASLSILANLSLNGLRYRVVVSGNTGCVVDTSTSSVLTVTPVAAVRLALNNPADVVAGGVRASYRVTRLNALNNLTGGSPLTVSLTSIPAQGLFYDASSGGQFLTQVVIPQDSVGADFWFTSLVADEYRIQASAIGLTSAEDTIVVNAGAAKGIRILAQDTAVVGDSVMLMGIIIDSLGNPSVLTNNIRVRLTSTDPTGIFIPDTIIPVSAGSTTYAYQYRSFISGLQTITATWLIVGTNNPNPNRTVGTKAIYFLPGAPVSLDVLIEPSDSARTGMVVARQPVVALRDSYGNRVPASGISVFAGVIPSGAILSGDIVVATTVLGVAEYAALILSGSTGTYRLLFTSPGLASDTSSGIYLLCPPSASTINRTICAPNSYTFNGQSYSTQGTYTATLTNAAGCDSVVTLNLTVSPNLGDSVASMSIGVVQGIPG